MPIAAQAHRDTKAKARAKSPANFKLGESYNKSAYKELKTSFLKLK